MSYPKSAIVDLSNEVWHAYIRWRMWPGEQPEILVNNGHLMGTRLFSSIFGGWRLFQPFFLGKLVMGLSNEGIPIKTFDFWDPPNFGLLNEKTHQFWFLLNISDPTEAGLQPPSTYGVYAYVKSSISIFMNWCKRLNLRFLVCSESWLKSLGQKIGSSQIAKTFNI